MYVAPTALGDSWNVTQRLPFGFAQGRRAGLTFAAPTALNAGGKRHKSKGADGRVKIPTRKPGVWGTRRAADQKRRRRKRE
jgi:hypothetical protein